jgi:hypothetical protein
VDWHDVDFPAVAAARRRLIPEHPNAHVIGADVTDPDWLDTVPSDRPAIIVADGLMGFLPDGNHRPALPLLNSFAVAHPYRPTFAFFAARPAGPAGRAVRRSGRCTTPQVGRGDHAMSAPAQPPARYRIRIRGHLDPAWSAWFDSLTVTQADDGTTELADPLVDPLVDQAALFGLLARVRDLGRDPAAGRAADGESEATRPRRRPAADDPDRVDPPLVRGREDVH